MDTTATATVIATLAPALFKYAIEAFKEKVSDAQTHKEAEKRFEARIEDIRATEQEYETLLPEDGDLHKFSQYLADDLYRTAQEAVRLDDESLTAEVFSFFRKQMKVLLSSTPNVPLTAQQLGEIRTELRLVKLKVLWASSQKSAKLQREDEQARNREIELIKKRADEHLLQRWMFVFLGVYTLLMVLLVIFARQFWESRISIPILGIPFSAILWSALGSLASMLYRFYKRSEVKNADQEFRWLFARPLVGIIMGAVTYLVVLSGAILVGFASFQTTTTQMKDEILWLFAFVGGFSDKVFEAVIERVGLMTTKEDKDKVDPRVLAEVIKLSQGLGFTEPEKGGDMFNEKVSYPVEELVAAAEARKDKAKA